MGQVAKLPFKLLVGRRHALRLDRAWFSYIFARFPILANLNLIQFKRCDNFK